MLTLNPFFSVMLSEQFPHEEPSLALQPIYQMSHNVHTMSVKDCKHDPHMSSEQILKYVRLVQRSQFMAVFIEVVKLHVSL